MSATRWLLIVILLLIVAGAGAYYWTRGYASRQSADIGSLAFVNPEVRKLDVAIAATGSIRLRVGTEVRVGSQLSGIVKKLNVTVGSHINKGDTIAEIDSRALEARIGQAQAQIGMDEVALRKARRDLERIKELFASGVVARKDLEDQQADVEAAEAKVEKSRHDLSLVQVDLAYVKIAAPISGTIASVTTQEGETVAASFATPTFVTIIEDNALELVAMVDETDIASVKPSNQATFTVETYPSREFTGQVKRIAPKATIVSGVVNYEVEITIGRDSNLLKPDMTANISIKTAQHETLVVADAAIQRSGDERFVYLEKQGKLEKQPVTIGIRDGGFTEVKKGLAATDRVLAGKPPGSEKRD